MIESEQIPALVEERGISWVLDEIIAARVGWAFDYALFAKLCEARPPTERTALMAQVVAALPVARKKKMARAILGMFAGWDEAAEVMAEGLPDAGNIVKPYFLARPAQIGLLEERTKRRGKTGEVYRALLAEIARSQTTESALPAEALPRCLRESPWENAPAPWPEQKLAVLAPAGSERLVANAEALELREDASRNYAYLRSGPTDEAEILAAKGVIAPHLFLRLGDEAALANIRRLPQNELIAALVRLGERAVPTLIDIMVAKPMASHAKLLPHVQSPRLAWSAWTTHADPDFLLADPTNAALGLVPALLGPVAQRWPSETGLHWLRANGHQGAIESAAAAYGVRDEVTAILARDGFHRVPPSIPPTNPRYVDGTLPALATDAGPIPLAQNERVAALVDASVPWLVHPGIAELRATCTRASRNAFAWDAYKKLGGLFTLGYLGDDEVVRKLDQELSAAGGALRMPRAYVALARIGTPLALAILQKQALKSAWPDRNAMIGQELGRVALERGVSVDELLARDGMPRFDEPIVLDYGASSFPVTIDDALVAHVDGGTKAPKPSKKDDPEKAAEAIARFKDLCLDLDDCRETITLVLERAMTSSRTWTATEHAALVKHPTWLRFARHLFWEGKRVFRVTEDGSLADTRDETMTLAPDEAVRLVHPVRLEPTELARCRQLASDYAFLPPFEQLERATFSLTDEEKTTTELNRHVGLVVATARRERLLGGPGWQNGRGSNAVRSFAGTTCSGTREARVPPPLAFRASFAGATCSGTREARVPPPLVELAVAATSVHRRGETAADRLGPLRVLGGGTFGDLGVVAASEILRDLATLPLSLTS